MLEKSNPMAETVSLEIQDQIATIYLNRAQAMNTYNEAMAIELLAHTEALSFNESVKVVVLRGKGPVFMAGGDIDFFAVKLPTMPQGIRTIIRMLADTIKNMRQSRQIYIAAVHGAVAGAGLSLMLACDLVLADPKTIFTTAYNRLGTSPDGGLSYFLPKLIGDKKAMELLLLSERLSAKDWLSLGLINAISDQGGLELKLQEWQRKLLGFSSYSSAHIKALIYQSHEASFDRQCELEAHCFLASVQTDFFKKGVQSFIEKRTIET